MKYKKTKKNFFPSILAPKVKKNRKKLIGLTPFWIWDLLVSFCLVGRNGHSPYLCMSTAKLSYAMLS